MITLGEERDLFLRLESGSLNPNKDLAVNKIELRRYPGYVTALYSESIQPCASPTLQSISGHVHSRLAIHFRYHSTNNSGLCN